MAEFDYVKFTKMIQEGKRSMHQRPLRTYIDAYQALIRGHQVQLDLTPERGNSKTLVMTPWQYGRRNFLPQVKDAIDKFRDENRPYHQVNWETIRVANKSQVQLQYNWKNFPMGATGVLLDFPSDELAIRVCFHGGQYTRMEWVDLWGNWSLVDVPQREACLSGFEFDLDKLADILVRAKQGDLISAAAWDWYAYHGQTRPWWMMDVNAFMGSPDYKSWERKRFESKLQEIF